MPLKGPASVYGRSQVADFICPDNGYRGTQLRRGIVPKDHMKENYRQLRQKQLQNRDDYVNKIKSKPESFSKLIEFKNVESRVYQERELSENNIPQTARTNDSVFLMKGANNRRLLNQVKKGQEARRQVEKNMKTAEYYSTAQRPSTPRKDPVPKANEIAQLAPRSQSNWITSNKIRMQTQMSSSTTGSRVLDQASNGQKPAPKHKSFGKVPSYLTQRKTEMRMQREHEEAMKPDKDCPPGMMLMPNEERLATLDTLHQSKEECVRQLSKMPIAIETLSLKEKQHSLECKLKEIDNAINLFSKPKVFITRD